MRIYALFGLILLALVAGCASNKPAQTAAAPAAPEPVKAQEATPLQRAQIKAGKCSAVLGENKKADEYFHRALGASPGNSIAAYNLALLAYREARLDDARSWLRPVMRDTSPRAEALYLGMCIERKQGDRQAEISYMTQLRNRFPESPEAKALATLTCE